MQKSRDLLPLIRLKLLDPPFYFRNAHAVLVTDFGFFCKGAFLPLIYRQIINSVGDSSPDE
jgi:hypothetical protein